MRGPNLKGFAEMAVTKCELFSVPHTYRTSADPWKNSPVASRGARHQDPGIREATLERTSETEKERTNGRGDGVATPYTHSTKARADFSIPPGTAMPSGTKKGTQVEYHVPRGGFRRAQSLKNDDCSQDAVMKRGLGRLHSRSRSEAAGSVSVDSGASKAKAGLFAGPLRGEILPS